MQVRKNLGQSDYNEIFKFYICPCDGLYSQKPFMMYQINQQKALMWN